MAASPTHHGPEEGVQRGLPSRRIRIHHDPNLSVRPDRLHGLLQGRAERCQGATPFMESRGGGEAVQILQQGDSPREFRVANVRQEGVEIADG